MTRYEQLLHQRAVMCAYLQLKVDIKDWHGVSDAANDLREIEVELKGLPIPDTLPAGDPLKWEYRREVLD